ncbi:hypothetical protein DL766_007368 [Monosporascus sp. MC13-8B]|uniref:Uncharacterized protein n=1 Tax=Monosporascus cannonballus TaxID=155416 RepID=A0ABY0H1S1_9PEZI|nr:hypothetical protein DL762_007624 [Monosporascus cannonballus]RYO85237.1 hypothetical protein DL763_007178 [Monosporascus cannonballus]RYP24111.1 hypothetical protein DL766_007368 [Monosporascus sp. MC13-8B]
MLISEASSAGVRQQQAAAGNAGLRTFRLILAPSRSQLEQEQRLAAMLHADTMVALRCGHEAVQQYEDRCAEGVGDPEYLEMLFKYLDSIKLWQEKIFGETAMQ